ncbi:MAG TPA: hypothetical protein VKV28_03695 [Candidatus Binataceae bacterium]|nr:hypothetical protein [Candidatus Binataceae bacterium]
MPRSGPVNEYEAAEEPSPLTAIADEAWPAAVTPELLLPVQYFARLRRRHALDGERLLMLSVLDDAIACLIARPRLGDAKAQRLAAEAKAWVDLHDSAWLFSFDNICAALDLDPDYLRARLRHWQERCADESSTSPATATRRRSRRKVCSPVISVG